ncbi:MFS transporter [Brachybacterium sp. DNPG3]
MSSSRPADCTAPESPSSLSASASGAVAAPVAAAPATATAAVLDPVAAPDGAAESGAPAAAPASADAPTPARSARAVSVGGFLAILSVGLIALNLRPGATSLGPVLSDVVASYGMGATASGLLTALPCLAFGVLGLVAVPTARRLGLTGTMVVAYVLVAIGLLLRPTTGAFGAFLALSVLGLLGPALGNVLVPAWIKRHGGARTVLLMTLYTGVLAIGGSLGSLLAVPLESAGADGWRESLQFWGLVAVIPVIVWAVVLTRVGHDFPPAEPTEKVGGSLLRSPTALVLTLMFGLQSTNAYTQFGLLPQILTSHGVSSGTAGAVVACIAGWGLVGGLVMPTVIARSHRLPWITGLFGLLTAGGYLGLLWLPQVSPFVWASVLGVGGFAFPTVIALIPARARTVEVTARLSGFVQPFGYILAAIGPIAAGALLDATGSTPAVLIAMAVSGVLLAVAGFRAALPRIVDDELAR